MNNVQLSGRLTSDPEIKMTQNGIPVCSYTLAVKKPRTKDETDFFDIVSWRQSAEYLSKYGRKGSMIIVTGTLTKRKWQDKEGNNRYSVEVVSDTVEIIGGGKYVDSTQTENPNFTELSSDDELPF